MEKTIEKLLYKQFDKKMRGYSTDQVDDFLDEVVEDIEALQKKYNLLLDEKRNLEKNNFDLKMKVLNLKEEIDNLENSKQIRRVPRAKIELPKQEEKQSFVHEASNEQDYTLQERIEQLEHELDNIKNFSD